VATWVIIARILTVECYGALPTGWVPCISWPLPELGDGKVEETPMLVPHQPSLVAFEHPVDVLLLISPPDLLKLSNPSEFASVYEKWKDNIFFS
jgi:hypothetical protein